MQEILDFNQQQWHQNLAKHVGYTRIGSWNLPSPRQFLVRVGDHSIWSPGNGKFKIKIHGINNNIRMFSHILWCYFQVFLLNVYWNYTCTFEDCSQHCGCMGWVNSQFQHCHVSTNSAEVFSKASFIQMRGGYKHLRLFRRFPNLSLLFLWSFAATICQVPKQLRCCVGFPWPCNMWLSAIISPVPSTKIRRNTMNHKFMYIYIYICVCVILCDDVWTDKYKYLPIQTTRYKNRPQIEASGRHTDLPHLAGSRGFPAVCRMLKISFGLVWFDDIIQLSGKSGHGTGTPSSLILILHVTCWLLLLLTCCWFQTR